MVGTNSMKNVLVNISFALLILSTGGLHAQDKPLDGEVSFKSSKHVYVKFPTTEDIQVGDTLFLKSKPALIVQNKSSVSCVCVALAGASVDVKDKIRAFPSTTQQQKSKQILKEKDEPKPIPEIVQDTLLDKTIKEPTSKKSKPVIFGKIDAASYSNFSNTERDNSQRMKYTLSLRTDNLPTEKFSAETYISFRHTQGEWDDVKRDLNSALKIYSLSVNYKMTEQLNISAGRKINPLISNMGAVDGFQFQYEKKKLKAGLLAGTRPDYQDYSFNKNLMQLGAYVAHEIKTETGYIRNSLAAVEQRNHSNTDRRFLYFQHQNQLLQKLYLFSSFEIDLYRKTKQGAENKLSLTGIYLLTTYRPIKDLSLSASYDARKQVIYYESYKSFVDQMIDQETRQGYRFRVNYRPWKRITLGINAGYRFRKSDPIASKNLDSYLSFRNFSAYNVTTTLSATYIESAYFTGNLYGVRMSKDFLRGKMQAGMGYKYVDYFYRSSEETILQDMVELNIHWRIYKKLSFSANYEFLGQGNDEFNRLYIQLKQRF